MDSYKSMAKKIALLLVYSLLILAIVLIIIIEVSERGGTPSVKKYPLMVPENLRFQVIGDYGDLESGDVLPNKTYRVELVSESMNARASKYPISMILTVGDNRYEYTRGTFDKTFYKFLRQVFNKPNLNSKPWYAAFGNHDCYHNPNFQIYMNQLYPEWNLMDVKSMEIPIGEGKKAKMIYLDSCVLICQNYTKYDNVKSECEEFYYKPSIEKIEAQYAWLKEDLENTDRNTVSWVMVYLHHPLFNAGQAHGDTEILKIVLYKILSQYKVDVVFCGHEHLNEYFLSPYNTPYDKSNSSDVCYHLESAPYGRDMNFEQGQYLHEILIGSSGKPLSEICPLKISSMAELAYANSIDNAYMEVEITPREVTLTMIGAREYNQTDNDFQSQILFTSKIHKI